MKGIEITIFLLLLIGVFVVGYRLGCYNAAGPNPQTVVQLQEQSAILSKRARDAYAERST